MIICSFSYVKGKACQGKVSNMLAIAKYFLFPYSQMLE